MNPLEPEELWEAARRDIRNLERLATFMGLPLPRKSSDYARRLIRAIRAREAQETPSEDQGGQAYRQTWTPPA